MIAPVAVTSAICLVIYVLVMPQLSSFLGLGSLLFAGMFLNCYFLSGGGPVLHQHGDAEHPSDSE